MNAHTDLGLKRTADFTLDPCVVKDISDVLCIHFKDVCGSERAERIVEKEVKNGVYFTEEKPWNFLTSLLTLNFRPPCPELLLLYTTYCIDSVPGSLQAKKYVVCLQALSPEFENGLSFLVDKLQEKHRGLHFIKKSSANLDDMIFRIPLYSHWTSITWVQAHKFLVEESKLPAEVAYQLLWEYPKLFEDEMFFMRVISDEQKRLSTSGS